MRICLLIRLISVYSFIFVSFPFMNGEKPIFGTKIAARASNASVFLLIEENIFALHHSYPSKLQKYGNANNVPKVEPMLAKAMTSRMWVT